MVGAGAYPSVAEAASATRSRGDRVEPAPGAWPPYAPAYARYRAAYGALRAITSMA